MLQYQLSRFPWKALYINVIPIKTYHHYHDYHHASRGNLLITFSLLDSSKHEEASTFLQIILSKEGPRRETVKCLLGRDMEDSLTVRLFRNWMKGAEEGFTSILGTLLGQSQAKITIGEEKENKLDPIRILLTFANLGVQYKDSSKGVRHLLDQLSTAISSDLKKAHSQLFADSCEGVVSVKQELTVKRESGVLVKQETKFKVESGLNITKIGIKKRSKGSLTSDIKEKSAKRKREAWII